MQHQFNNMNSRKQKELFGLSELDLWHHIVLILIIVISFFAFILASNSLVYQLLVGFSASLLYVAWGVVHHYYDNDLHFKNVIEYVLIAILGMIILTGILV